MDLDEIRVEPSSNPVVGASSVPQDDSSGLNEMSPEDVDSLKKQVFEYALIDRWKEAEPIFKKYGEMVRIPLTDDKETALHVAVSANSITFVKGLVNLMTPQHLEIQNRDRYTAFQRAAISGDSDLVQIMIRKNQNLPLIKMRDLLPVHRAAFFGQHKIVQDLTSKTLLQKMDSQDIEQLFFMTIKFDMFDVATKLFEEHPALLAIAKYYGYRYGTQLDSEMLKSETNVSTKLFQEYNPELAIAKHDWCYGMQQTALEMLMRKSSHRLRTKEGSNNNRAASWGKSLQLLQKIWLQLITQLGWTGILELIGTNSFVSAIAYALESGNVDAVERLIGDNSDLSLPVNFDEQILHYAVRQRHISIVSYLCHQIRPPRSDIELAVDKDGNNILHLAAYPLEKEETSSTLRPTTRMTREVKWFEEIKKKTPCELRKMINKEGKTPKDVFQNEHKELSEQVKDTAKGIAESGMLVAALVATVAFAAALVVPGDDKTNPWFTVFMLANAAALFTSSASLLSFLSNFTSSRFADSEFVIALHPSLILGPLLLLISIVTMVISFAAASFLIFEHTSKWVAYVVTSMGVFPILLFLLFHFSIFDTFIWSRFYRMP